ncbi:hypothetical protein EH227_09990 [Rouxiella chamberiensis]|nr:hypothetical protein EH227_09990 [Rouxiella chamberiensis]
MSKTDARNCSENDCATLAKFEIPVRLWINLCKTRYKRCVCCVMQQTVFFLKISPCGLLRTPYNAAPSTGNNVNNITK